MPKAGLNMRARSTHGCLRSGNCSTGIVRNVLTSVDALLRDVLTTVATRPVADAAREWVKASIDAHRVDPKLHRVLAQQIPRVGRPDNMHAIDRETYALVRSYLEAHRHEIDVADVSLAAFICVATVEALTHAAVVNRPEVRIRSSKR